MNCASARCSVRQLAAHHGEARAGKLGARLAVQPAVALAEVDVILDREIELARRAPAQDFLVVVFVLAQRHGRVRDVRQAQRDLGELGLYVGQRLFVGLELVADAGDFGHQRGDVLALALGLADGLGPRITQVLQFLGLGGQLLALTLQGLDGGHVERETTGFLEALGGFGQARTQQCGVQHDRSRVMTRNAGLSLCGWDGRNVGGLGWVGPPA